MDTHPINAVRITPLLGEPSGGARGARTLDYSSHEPDFASRLRHQYSVIQKHVRLIIISVISCVVACAVVVFLLMTPSYTATTRLLIERNPPQVLALRDDLISPEPLMPDEHDFYRTQDEMLQSRDLAAQVIRDENLDQASFLTQKRGILGAVSHFVSQVYWAMGVKPTVVKEDGIDSALIDSYLTDLLDIKPVPQTRIVEVSISTPNRDLSAKIANAHAETYIRRGVELRSQPGQDAEAFLNDKLGELRERVRRSETALNTFRRQHGIVDDIDGLVDRLPSDKGGSNPAETDIVMQRLADINKLLTEAEADRIGLEAQENLIARQNYDALPQVVNSTLIQTLKTQTATLEETYASAFSRFTANYPVVQQARAQLDEAKAHLSREIHQVVESIHEAYQAAKQKEDNLRLSLEAQKAAALALRDDAVNYALLERDADTNRQLYDNVVQRIKELAMTTQLRASNVSIVDRASPPIHPSSPKRLLSLVLSALIGLFGGVACAFFLESLDSTIRTPQELELRLGVPVLTSVPLFTRRALGPSLDTSPTLSSLNPRELPAVFGPATGSDHQADELVECYRSLQVELLAASGRDNGRPKRILFTSSIAGEGKTITALNCAMSFAESGSRVLLIDAELRRSSCHTHLGVANDLGLSDVLMNACSTQSAIKSIIPGRLDLLSSGSVAPNPAALLGSSRMVDLLNSATVDYDHILVDSCPVLPVSDTLMLSRNVDAVVFVLDASKTMRDSALRALVKLARAHACVIGAVINKVDPANSFSTYYYNYV